MSIFECTIECIFECVIVSVRIKEEQLSIASHRSQYFFDQINAVCVYLCVCVYFFDDRWMDERRRGQLHEKRLFEGVCDSRCWVEGGTISQLKRN